jgi:hypothetical protein
MQPGLRIREFFLSYLTLPVVINALSLLCRSTGSTNVVRRHCHDSTNTHGPRKCVATIVGSHDSRKSNVVLVLDNY